MPLFAPVALGQTKPRVVVVGGGPGGGTVARYVAKDAAGAIDVTLIEPQREIHHVLLLQPLCRRVPQLPVDHARLPEGRAGNGVRVVHEWAKSINRDRKHVVLAGGARVPYDRLVIAPGIDLKWDSVPGYSEAAAEIMPHAWKAGRADQRAGRSG